MRALYITRVGGPEVLELRTSPDPSPGPGQVLVRAERTGLNFADIAARVGVYPDAPKPPMVMGYEAAGVIERVGDGVSPERVGQRVVALSQFRAHADCVLVPAVQAVEIPAAMSLDEAAALPVNYLTAYHMLHHVAHLRPGARVLVHMAAGGVGLAAIQLCRLVDGVEIFGTASAGKHDLLREVGVDHPIDYRSTDYARAVREITGGRGVDLVLDALGGKDWRKGYDLLAPAGHLVAFGWANMVKNGRRSLLHLVRELLSMKRYAPFQLMNDNRSVSGVNLGHLWDEMPLLRGHLDALLALYEQGRIRPRIDRVFPLSAAAEAHRHMQERKNTGKVLLDCTA